EEVLGVAVLQRREEDRPIFLLDGRGEARRAGFARSRAISGADAAAPLRARSQPVDPGVAVWRIRAGAVEFDRIGGVEPAVGLACDLDWLLDAVDEQLQRAG